MTIAIDTLKASEILEDAGFKDKQAKALIEALTPASKELITKDVLRAEINSLKSQMIMWMVGLHVATVSLIVGFIT